ncbi:ABC transporter permease [Burkholderia cepacia]|uniref:ABC transporter permease n=1 Tax=Burkholderia cepacia TaxID=292 RepID=UPI001296677F|nr:ABC transporter permease [Burkholderia cepacia]MBY4709349.1 ABC transporter permease [Burkholderia cepacia]MBY4737825.1 ABC transporter permease [Burkholderia cepacia]MBY4745685.1 ABC transporter permease [Burkholderia cepacia]MBY4759029.1 ABC transporter permease [Burkholderia cepacia]MBY4774558.1 ABC transporter permease [Burkholderia cepacia]
MNTGTSLRRSFDIQRRVIGALLMREILTRYGRHNIGFMWLFFEPMLFTLGITLLWSMVKVEHVANVPITPFALTGYSSVLVWRNAVNRCNLAIEPNLSLLFHRNVRVLDIFVARILLEIAGATISFIVLALVFISTGLAKPPSDVLRIAEGWALLIGYAVGLGLVIGSLSERSETIDRVWHTITYLTFPLSGAAFMVDWLPQSLQRLALYMPMVNGVEMLREGYFGAPLKFHYDWAYFAIVDLILIFAGLFMARETGKRVEPQ